MDVWTQIQEQGRALKCLGGDWKNVPANGTHGPQPVVSTPGLPVQSLPRFLPARLPSRFSTGSIGEAR